MGPDLLRPTTTSSRSPRAVNIGFFNMHLEAILTTPPTKLRRKVRRRQRHLEHCLSKAIRGRQPCTRSLVARDESSIPKHIVRVDSRDAGAIHAAPSFEPLEANPADVYASTATGDKKNLPATAHLMLWSHQLTRIASVKADLPGYYRNLSTQR